VVLDTCTMAKSGMGSSCSMCHPATTGKVSGQASVGSVPCCTTGTPAERNLTEFVVVQHTHTVVQPLVEGPVMQMPEISTATASAFVFPTHHFLSPPSSRDIPVQTSCWLI
jgi:hypothetical protein